MGIHNVIMYTDSMCGTACCQFGLPSEMQTIKLVVMGNSGVETPLCMDRLVVFFFSPFIVKFFAYELGMMEEHIGWYSIGISP